MDNSLRLVLLVLSALAILGIYLHGRFSLKKSSDQEQNSQRKDPVYDDTGFDQFGVSKKRVIEDTLPNEHKPLVEEQYTAQESETVEPRFSTDDSSAASEPGMAPSDTNLDTRSTAASDNDLQHVEAVESGNQSLYAEADVASQATPHIEPELVLDTAPQGASDRSSPEAYKTESQPVAKQTKVIEADELQEVAEEDESSGLIGGVKNSLESIMLPKRAPRKRRPRRDPKFDENQLEMFGGGSPENSKPGLKSAPAEPKISKPAKASAPPPTEEVIALNVMAQEGQEINGAQLLPAFLTLGLKFGEFNIFHRHQDNAGNGPVLFSVANMFKPGTFDLDNMENFTTKGISLFMSLPLEEGDPQQTFAMMHNAARKLAEEFNAQVLDGSRSVLTKQKVQHYGEQIREFERRKLLAR